jgi:hypothetical protein
MSDRGNLGKRGAVLIIGRACATSSGVLGWGYYCMRNQHTVPEARNAETDGEQIDIKRRSILLL